MQGRKHMIISFYEANNEKRAQAALFLSKINVYPIFFAKIALEANTA